MADNQNIHIANDEKKIITKRKTRKIEKWQSFRKRLKLNLKHNRPFECAGFIKSASTSGWNEDVNPIPRVERMACSLQVKKT